MRVGTSVIGLGGIVAGGILLGSMVGSMVDPIPRNLAADGALAAGSFDAAPSYDSAPSYQFVEAGPADLTALPMSDGAAPSWASEGTAWTYPEPDYSPWTPEPYPSLAELDAQIEAERAAAELAVAELAATAAEVAPPEIAPALPAEPPLRESDLAALY